MLWPSSPPQLSSMDECLNLTTLPIILPPSNSPISTPLLQPHAAFEYNTVVILAAMSCALVCALGLHSVLYCVVRCTRRAVSEPIGWFASRRLNGGLKRTEVAALPVVVYAVSVVSSSPLPGCAICLLDFSEGDKIRVLPACRHQFHVKCIDKWLLSHCSCPTCRCCLSGGRNTEQTLEIVTAA